MKQLYFNYYQKVIQWKNKSKSKERIFFFLTFSVCFLLLSIGVFSAFWINDRSFIWSVDGSKQHYPSLVYFGRYLRDTFNNFIETGSLQFKMWDNSLGFGGDVLTTLNYYSIGDPLDILAGFVPSNYTEYLYNFLVLLRLYLAGLAFSYFSFYQKNRTFTTFIGSFSYIFCGFTLFSAVRHPFFVNPMIYLPILLVGVEKILKKEKTVLFPIIVAIALISNFYYFYSLTIFMFTYAFLRFYELYSENRFKEFWCAIFRAVKAFLIGVLCAMVIFLPVLLAFTESGRSGGSNIVNYFFFNKSYYLNLLGSVFQGATISNYTCLGFNVVAMLAVILFVIQRTKENRTFRVLVIGSFVMLLFPVFGYIMNGFSYVSNRWTYLLSFVIAYILVITYDQFKNITASQAKILVGVAIGYSVIVLATTAISNEKYNKGAAILLIVTLLVCLFRKFYSANHRKTRILWQTIFTITIFADILYRANGIYSIYEEDYVSSFFESGKALDTITDEAMKQMKKVENGQDYRVDVIDRNSRNYALTAGVSSISHYYSVTSKYIADFSRLLANVDEETLSSIGNLDNRTGLNELTAIKYIATSNRVNGITMIPYGYQLVHETAKTKNGTEYTYQVYENQFALPMLYSFQQYISREEFETLSYVQREQAMLQGIVLDEASTHVKEAELEFTDQTILSKEDIYNSIKKQINNGKLTNIKLVDDKIVTLADNVTITFDMKGLPNAETYLQSYGFAFESFSPTEFHDLIDGKELSTIEQNKLKRGDWLWSNDTMTTLRVQVGTKSNMDEMHTKYHTYYSGLDDSLLNMGYSEEPLTQFQLRLGKKGAYFFEDIQVVARTMANYESQVDALKAVQISDLTQADNYIGANVNAPEDSMLCLAYPYSSGWRAYVDGQEVDVLNGNIMFMSIPITAGTHTVEFRYCTPGLKTGAMLSGIGITLLILDSVWICRKKKI